MEELNGIDTSTIEELRRIKDEQQVLGERLERMGERRGSTTPQVFERVERDYRARHRGLEDRAKPLKEAARREFSKLEGLAKKIQQALDVVKLDKEELEFRNSIGEYDQKTFEEGLRSVEAKIAERQTELRACEEVRGRFLDAFPSEDDLRIPAPPLPPPPPAAPAPSPQTAPVAAAPAPTPPAPPAEEPAAEQPAPAQTAVVAAVPAEPAEEGGATRVLPLARLVLAKEDGSTEEFRLGAQTLIGRAPDAQVRINAAAVSRKHSQVVLTPEGYKIVDLGSENGTYVNGSRVQEKVLQNGDRVQIGMARFVYRA
jgi:hypothetical protein